MTDFISKSGVIDLSVGDSPSRAGTPILEMQNLIPGNLVEIKCNFFARTNQPGRGNGFYYDISAVNTDEIEALTPTEGIFQSSDGWQSATLIALFKVVKVSNSPTEDVDFEVLFHKGDLNGAGQLLNFVLVGDVISTNEP
ncbi:MAG TPA: hypothetical protein VGD99_10595 [Anaerolineae bacterium]|jgi:hypothetical protein